MFFFVRPHQFWKHGRRFVRSCREHHHDMDMEYGTKPSAGTTLEFNQILKEGEKGGRDASTVGEKIMIGDGRGNNNLRNSCCSDAYKSQWPLFLTDWH